jgi:hypothetical protein
MHKESLIVEQIVAKVGLDPGGVDSSPGTEFGRIAAALRLICDVHRRHRFTIYGRVHTVVHSRPGSKSEATSCAQRSDGGVKARVVLQVEECPAQRVMLGFKLVSGFDPYPASLHATFNPTTILAGNNVHPVTVADPETGEIRPFPSSDPLVVARMNRLGFDLLEQLHQQATKTRALLFHPATRALIQGGDVHLVRAQWCAYFPTPDVPRFLQTVGLMYDHAIAEGRGIVRVARHLGLSFRYYPEAADACDTTGVMLIKSHGKKPLFSLVFYDKRRRVADMKQGKSLSAQETATIRDNVRFDVTLHSAGIVALVVEARRRLPKLVAARPCFGRTWKEEFLAGDPKPSLWFLERAVRILSVRILDGELTRRSFSAWLVPHLIKDVLRLDVLGSFDRGNLHRLAALDDPVAAAWRKDRANEPRGWVKRLAKAAGCSLPTVYERRDAWLKEFGIDIAVPFAAYRDILFFGSHSVMPPDQRWAFLAAGQTNRPLDIGKIFEEAAQDFERRRREIVGWTINRRPLAMEIKLASEPASAGPSRGAGAAIGLLAPSRGLVGSVSLSQRSRSSSGQGPAINRNVSKCIFSLTRLIGSDSVAA